MIYLAVITENEGQILQTGIKEGAKTCRRSQNDGRLKK